MPPIKNIGIALIVFSSFTILLLLFHKNESFFNLRTVIKEHLGLFKHCKSQYIIFYILPLFFAAGLALLYEGGERFYTELSVVMGIILSMLFAILSILSGHDFSTVKDETQQTMAKKVVKETINAIIFDSMLCLFLLLYGLVMIVVEGISFTEVSLSPTAIAIATCILAGISYYIFAVILLTLLLIIKQMSKLVEFNMNVKKK